MKNSNLALTVALAAFALPAFAQNSAIGMWKAVEGDKVTLIRITEEGGKLSGKVEKVLRGTAEDKDAKCVKCKDDLKDKPMAGLRLIWDMSKDGEGWSGGKLLDPESGRIVNCKLETAEGGKKLTVKGSVSFISKTQTWVRGD